MWRALHAPVTGMSCVNCAQSIERFLKKDKRLRSVRVHFATEKLQLQYNTEDIQPREVGALVRDFGYGLDLSGAEDTESIEQKSAWRRMVWMWLALLPTLIMRVLMWLGADVSLELHWGEYLFATAATFILGKRVFASAFGSLKHGYLGMDVLIAGGVLVAAITGMLPWFGFPDFGYAMIAPMLMAFYLTGQALERMAKGRAAASLRALMDLGQKTAHLEADQTVTDIAVEDVQVGMTLRVFPGEKIPVDSQIITGTSYVDESLVTGEPWARECAPGDKLVGGSVNQQGTLLVKALHTDSDGFLEELRHLIEESQSTAIPVQALADRITQYFVPAVIFLASFAFAFWWLSPWATSLLGFFDERFAWVTLSDMPRFYALQAFVATLLVACPCALGLAIPVTLLVGVGRGAHMGILIRRGEAIQTMQYVTHIIFDKTGTLTQGMVQVTHTWSAADAPDAVARMIAVENFSEHPIAKAFMRYRDTENIASIGLPDSWEALRGLGVYSNLPGLGRHAFGSRRFMESLDMRIPEDSPMSAWEQAGSSVVFLACQDEANGIWRLTGAAALADPVRPDALAVVRELQQMGLHVIVATGDSQFVTERLAKELGIETVKTHMLPSDKVELVNHLEMEGHRVLMLGDGINDTAALKRASVGVAMGSGSDLSLYNSDIVLVRSHLKAIVQTIYLSKATFRKIRQNLAWALGYNALMIPLAMLGLIHPVFAEVAMAFSSLSVVTNALLLKNASLGVA